MSHEVFLGGKVLMLSGPEERRRESIKAKTKDQPVDHGPLFSLSSPSKLEAI